MSYRSNNRSSAMTISFIWPFAGLINSLVNWRKPWAKNAFWMVCTFLGAVFIYQPEGTILGTGADGGRYVLELISFHDSKLGLFGTLAHYTLSNGGIDYYQPVVTFIISRFTDNGHVLFAVFAFVFGFFYSRNIWYILDRLPNRKLKGMVILVAMYFLVCPIYQINGLRMWTALHVFVYGMMPYLLEEDKSKFGYIVLAPFIHFSFFYVSLLAFAYSLLPASWKGNDKVVLNAALLFFIATFAISSLNMNAVNAVLLEYSPESFERRVELYANQDLLNSNKEVSAMNNWYIAAASLIQQWSYNLLLVFMLPCLFRNFKRNNGIMSLYMFSLLLGGMANIMALVPSGGRFQLLSAMFKVPLILIVAMSIPSQDGIRKYLNISLFLLLIPLMVEIRKIFDFYGVTAVIGNYVTVLFWEDNVQLIDFVKDLL